MQFSLALRTPASGLVAGVLMFVAACGDAVSPELPVDGGVQDARTRPAPEPAPGPTPPPPPPSPGNALADATLYVDPISRARQTVNSWVTTRPADAVQMEKIASQPHSKWFGDWNTNIRADVDRVVSSAAAVNAVPVLVAYNIPMRDCGSYSGGGASSPDAYRSWIGNFAAGLGTRRAIVILEPDALAGMGCLSAANQQIRAELLSHAVTVLRAQGRAAVYLDAGHSRWQPASIIAARLSAAGIANANGFSLNVSNFQYTVDQIRYGNAVSALVGGKHYVIDTSRNGLGPAADGQWCNPEGRAIGDRPTVNTGAPLADAFLWVKTAGESDGSCNGNPSSGTWMPEYALGLAQRAAY